MGRRDDYEREVVYVEREEPSFRPIIIGAVLGLALGIMFAPQSGEETRRLVRRRLRKVRALAEEKVGEFSDRITGEFQRPVKARREELRDDARSDLERRLAEARARRRGAVGAEDEEPVA
ncbi:MAG TPA: YtxH domain-containing protein [Gemmatimonadales bacterium]|nr:YtxH domain-containing protein [Gemmatimonadales bacterium]